MSTEEAQRKPLHRGRLFGGLAVVSALLLMAGEWLGRKLARRWAP